MPRTRGRSGLGVITATTNAVTVLLLGIPFGFLMFTSFRKTENALPFEPESAFTLDNYIQVFGSLRTYSLLAYTSVFAVASVALALILALAFCYVLERTDLPFRGAVKSLMMAPMGLPPFAAGIAWVLIAAPDFGALNMLLDSYFGIGRSTVDIFTLPGMIFVMGTMFLPSMYLMISGTFVQMDASYEEASRASGAGRLRTYFKVTLPLMMPAIASAVIFYLVTAFEVFEIPALLGLRTRDYTLSTWIYYLVNPSGGLPNYGLASAYAMVILVLIAILLIAYRRYVHRRRREFVTISGKGHRRELAQLGRWKYVVLAGVCLYSLVAFVLPMGVLIWRSLLPSFASITAVGPFSLDAYTRILESPDIRQVIVNTVVIAATSSVATMILANFIAWLGVSKASPAAKIADTLSFVSQGFPAIVIAISIGLVFLYLPVPIYGTVWIIAIALSIRYLAYAVRLMSAAYIQISGELEEASWASGAGPLRTLWTVVVPLVWPSNKRGLLWVAVHAFRDATVAIVLVSVTNSTYAARIWFVWFDEGNFAYAAALCVPLAAVSLVLTWLLGRQKDDTRVGGSV